MLHIGFEDRRSGGGLGGKKTPYSDILDHLTDLFMILNRR